MTKLYRPRFRAWYKGDIDCGEPLKFSQDYDDENHKLVFRHDSELYYDFEIPFSDNDWIIEQSTGFKDKNRVEVFEGDILYAKNFMANKYINKLNQTNKSLRIVKRDEDNFLSLSFIDEDKWAPGGWTLSSLTLGKVFVIGNVYQKPIIEDNKIYPWGSNEGLPV